MEKFVSNLPKPYFAGQFEPVFENLKTLPEGEGSLFLLFPSYHQHTKNFAPSLCNRLTFVV